MTIGIIGSRKRNSFEDYQKVKEAFYKVYKKGDTIVSGGCRLGGDRFAEIIAYNNDIPIKIYRADWNKHGKSAGYKRNIFIAKDADILIACVAEDRTGGAEDTINKYHMFGKDKLMIV